MNNVLLYIKERKFLNTLLRNSSFISDDINIEETTISFIKNILSKHNVEYQQEFKNTSADIIITDNISIAKDIFDKKIIFIPPIDFNVIDGFVNELRIIKNESLNVDIGVLKYLEKYHPNLIFVSPSLIDHPNIIFDLPLILNYNLYDLKWGAIHHNAKDLFKTIKNKPYRIDFSIREVRKINRIKIFLDLIESNLKNNIKLTIHNLFLFHSGMYELTKKYFEENDSIEYFKKIINLDSKYYSGDAIDNDKFSFQEWPINKLIHHTFMSDIAFYFESAPEGNQKVSMDYLITEKTIDLLSIGKPFIYNNKIVKDFIDKFGFVDYHKSFLVKFGKSSYEIIKTILEMNEGEYITILDTLNRLAVRNVNKLHEYTSKNTFLERLIHN